jgi:hypothetical protein
MSVSASGSSRICVGLTCLPQGHRPLADIDAVNYTLYDVHRCTTHNNIIDLLLPQSAPSATHQVDFNGLWGLADG